MDTRYSSHKAL